MYDFLWLPSMGCQYRYHIAIFVGFASRYVAGVSLKRSEKGQAGGATLQASSLASYALGLACSTSSSFRVGLPEFRPMRGHILGSTVRCLSGVGCNLQACRVTRVNRLLVHDCQSSVLGELNNAGGRYKPGNRPHWLWKLEDHQPWVIERSLMMQIEASSGSVVSE
jgi:hypothetical protein